MRSEALEENIMCRQTFSNQMRKCMESEGIDLNELSLRTGITRKSLYDYSVGATTPNVVKLDRICIGLGVSPNDLMGW